MFVYFILYFLLFIYVSFSVTTCIIKHTYILFFLRKSNCIININILSPFWKKMDDIMVHRIVIGLFYCKIHGCCRHSKLNRCFSLFYMMFDVFSILDVSETCRVTSATVILSFLQIYSKNIMYFVYANVMVNCMRRCRNQPRTCW